MKTIGMIDGTGWPSTAEYYRLLNKEIKDKFLNIIRILGQKGAQGIVLGCTEIPLLIKQEDTPLPVFNTLSIHVRAAVEFALQ